MTGLYKHQSTALCSNTFGFWILVCAHASVYSPLFKHVWIVDPCLRTRISLQPFDQTRLDYGSFGLWFLVVYKHQSPPVSQTRLDYGSLSAYTHQSPALCFECVWIVDPCLCTRIRLQPCSNTFDYGCLFVYHPAHTTIKVTPVLGKILHRARAPNQMSIFWAKSIGLE